MSQPKITEILGGYLFDWEEEKVRISVKRIKQHNDGRVNGEVIVTTTLPNYNPHLHQATLNFLSTAAQEKLTKSLTASCSEVLWYPILEQLKVYTLDYLRRGEPVLELWADENATPPEYVLEPILIRNYPTVIFGHRSTAKSTLAVIMVEIILLPWLDNPLGLSPLEHSTKCLYLDYETDHSTIKWQLARLQKGMNLATAPISYRRCAVPLAQDLEQIQQHIQDRETEVIVIDSLGLACGGELKDSAPAIAFYAALRQLKVTPLILAHTSKENDVGRTKSVFGSGYFENLARSVFEIRKTQEPGSNEINVALFHRKPPPFQPIHQPLGYHFDFTASTMIVSEQNPRSVKEFLSAIGTQAQIEELLKEGTLNTKEMMDALNLTRSNTDMALKRLRDKKRIIKLDDGRWGLVTPLVDEVGVDE